MRDPKDIDDLAHALFAALRDGSDNALVMGDPLDSTYFEGELIHGVLLDGRFDLRRVAALLLAELDKMRRSPA